MWTPAPLLLRSSGRGLWISWSLPASWRFSAETGFSGVHEPCCWIKDKMTSTTYRDWNGTSQTVNGFTYPAIKNKHEIEVIAKQHYIFWVFVCQLSINNTNSTQLIVLIKILSDKALPRLCPYMISEILTVHHVLPLAQFKTITSS